ncbi:MAG: hypothetical protein HZB51_26420 [Chloroflexi bacterium]|nr:hypothetical protein [Chloroflexota bacterium]
MKKRSKNETKLPIKAIQAPQASPVVAHAKNELTEDERRRRAILLANIYELILSWDDPTETPNNENEPAPSEES